MKLFGMQFSLVFARWLTRTLLTLGEVLLIAYVIHLLFVGASLEEHMMNSLSVVLGALLLNFGKASSYWFSTESNFEGEDGGPGNQRESLPKPKADDK